MPAEPPYEWADGDPVLSGRFAFAMALILAAGAALVVLAWVDLLELSGYATLQDSYVLPLAALVAAYAAIGIGVGYYVPRWVPVVSRVGISPAGLAFVSPVGTSRVPWSHVAGIGPDWVRLATDLGRRPVKLTPYQAGRILAFLRPS